MKQRALYDHHMITVIAQNARFNLAIPEDTEDAFIEKLLAGEVKTRHSGWYPVQESRVFVNTYVNVNTGVVVEHRHA